MPHACRAGGLAAGAECNWGAGVGVAAPAAPDSRPPNSHRAQRLRLAKLVGDVLEGRALLGVGVVVHLQGGQVQWRGAGGLRGGAGGPQACPPRSGGGGGARRSCGVPLGRTVQKSAGAAAPAYLGPRRPLAAREAVHRHHRSAIGLHGQPAATTRPTTLARSLLAAAAQRREAGTSIGSSGDVRSSGGRRQGAACLMRRRARWPSVSARRASGGPQPAVPALPGRLQRL